MNIPFVKARYFTSVPVSAPRRKDLIVLHTMENAEKPGSALAVAKWLQTVMPKPVSFHYGVDAEQVVQSVRDEDVAWAAPGTNHNGIHIEHVGRASQTPLQWSDDFSSNELQISAELCAQLCTKYQIPVKFIPAEQLLQGFRGVTTHAEVAKACQLAQQRGMKDSHFFNHKANKPLTDHTDPGQGFPMNRYIELVRYITDWNEFIP